MLTTATFRASRSVTSPVFRAWLKGLFFSPRRPSAAPASRLLRPGQVERITVDAPTEISCPAGRVWITQDGGGPDIVLDAGESHWFSRSGSFLAEALLDSEITLRNRA